MCGRGRSTYTIHYIASITRARPIPSRVYGRGMRNTQRSVQHFSTNSNQNRSNSSSTLSTTAQVQEIELVTSDYLVSSSGKSTLSAKNVTTDKIENHSISSDFIETRGIQETDFDGSEGENSENSLVYEPIENLSPGMSVPVVLTQIESHRPPPPHQQQQQHRAIHLMKWGLIPSYTSNRSPSSSDYYKMFNARIETVMEKVSYKNLLYRNRCIVLFDGYYEWKGVPGNKTPYYVSLEEKEPMIMACLYDRIENSLRINEDNSSINSGSNRDNDNQSIESFTILTCDACEQLKGLHHRQPVFLKPNQIDDWLNPSNSPIKLLDAISKQTYEEFKFIIYEVTKQVSNAKYQGIDCSFPIPSKPALKSTLKSTVTSHSIQTTLSFIKSDTKSKTVNKIPFIDLNEDMDMNINTNQIPCKRPRLHRESTVE